MSHLVTDIERPWAGPGKHGKTMTGALTVAGASMPGRLPDRRSSLRARVPMQRSRARRRGAVVFRASPGRPADGGASACRVVSRDAPEPCRVPILRAAQAGCRPIKDLRRPCTACQRGCPQQRWTGESRGSRDRGRLVRQTTCETHRHSKDSVHRCPSTGPPAPSLGHPVSCLSQPLRSAPGRGAEARSSSRTPSGTPLRSASGRTGNDACTRGSVP